MPKVAQLVVGNIIEVDIIDGPCYITAIGPIQCDDMRQIRIAANPPSESTPDETQIWLNLYNDGTFLGVDFSFGDDLHWSLNIL
mgnify:CR=1 FL=1